MSRDFRSTFTLIAAMTVSAFAIRIFARWTGFPSATARIAGTFFARAFVGGAFSFFAMFFRVFAVRTFCASAIAFTGFRDVRHDFRLS